MAGVIQIKAELNGDQSVDFTVSDNGKGIPVKNLKHVFDPFFTTRMGVGGSGLGLNIVYNMVTSTLGGTIVVKSEEGSQTTFSISMPLVAPPATKT
jgi:signal transduction histidine kinase